MENVCSKASEYLYENTVLIDKLYMRLMKLTFKRLQNFGNNNRELGVICSEIKFLINEQKRDREGVVFVLEYINKFEEQMSENDLEEIKRTFIALIFYLRDGLLTNEMYLLNKGENFFDQEEIPTNNNINFEGILEDRKVIEQKRLTLRSKLK